MRPLDQQTILITGSTDGLGRQTALALARQGAKVLLHGRDRERAERTAADIGHRTQNDQLEFYVADLSALEEVRRLASEVEERNDRLDVLVNNAGIGRMGTERSVSRDGYELTLAVNYLSHFLLTELLLPLLRRSAPARIVNVASVGQAPIDFDDPMLEREYEGFRAYRQSKLAQIIFTFELAERLDPTEVTVNAVHPATLMDTKMVRESFGRTMSSVEEGVDAAMQLIASPALDGISGRYFDGLEESAAHDQAYDRDARRRLLELSQELSGLDRATT
jgi:NAD(P)-dependent dehydrogenase (short-subunit alcohol dehydrogenase family)